MDLVCVIIRGLLFLITLISGIRAEQLETRYRITEEETSGTFLGAIVQDVHLDKSYEPDVLVQLSFEFLRKNQEYFSIESETGVIRSRQKLDRDVMCPGWEVCEVRIDVAIQPVEHMQIVKITVEILDVNDNFPVFPDAEVFHEMRESAMVGRSSFVAPAASDPDSPRNSIQEYQLIGGDEQFELQVQEKFDGSVQLKVILKRPLDREEQESYELEIVATDGGIPAKSGTLLVHVRVLDTNDNSPEFEKPVYEVFIDENVPRMTTVVRVKAEDRDHGLNGKVIYSLSSHTQLKHGDVFGMDEETGEIYVQGVIDYETTPVYNLAVVALDQGADAIPGDAAVVVHVRDVNDHAPEIAVNTLSSPQPGVAVVLEDATLGTFVAHITVQDKDTAMNAMFNCSLNDNHFELKNLYDGEYQVLTAAVLDREKQSRYNLAVLCRDKGKEPQTGVVHIPVNVTDINDHAPVFSQPSYSAEIIERNYIGAVVLRINATDKDLGDNAKIVYTIPGRAGRYFNVDSRTGDLKAKVSLDREDIEVHRFVVEAHDNGNPALSTTASVEVTILDVNDEKPTFMEDSYSLGVYENEPIGSEVGLVTAEDRDSAPYNEFTYSILPSHTSTNTFTIDRHTGRITNTKILDREAQSVYYLLVSASDRGIPPLSSTASVSIFVADRNDNPPVFEYPKQNNNTLHISNQASKGYLVTRIKAFDLDIAGNAQLTYHFKTVKGQKQAYFDLDPKLGTIIVNRDLSHIQNEIFQFSIEARDGGDPPLSAFSSVNIIVNKSVALPLGADDDDAVLSGHNLIIVIALACVSAVVTIVLVVAIVMIRRQDRNKPTAKYNCRMEALKMLSAKETLKERDSDSSDYARTLPNGKGPVSPVGTCERHRKEILYVDDPCSNLASPVNEKSQQSWPSTIEANSLQSQQNGSIITQGNIQSPSYNHRNIPPQHWAPNYSQKDKEVHQLLQLLRQDPDASSVHSAEGSATDSGRGLSEEGEHARQTDQHAVAHAPHHNQPGHNHSCHSDQSLSNQVVPDPSLSSCHSYSSQTPRVLHTFKDPGAGGGGVARVPHPSGGSVLSSRPAFDGGLSPSSSMVLSKLSDAPGNAYHGNSVLSFNSSEESDVTTPVVQYSCADISEDPTQKAFAVTAHVSADDEMNTTTSGSYSVDPQDLCDEIDELFFKDMGV